MKITKSMLVEKGAWAEQEARIEEAFWMHEEWDRFLSKICFKEEAIGRDEYFQLWQETWHQANNFKDKVRAETFEEGEKK